MDVEVVRTLKSLWVEQPDNISCKTITKHVALQNDEVRLRPIYGGICGSDVAVYQGKLPHASYPVVPGHELLAEVIEVNNNDLNIGQRVVIQPNSYCDKCEYCKAGQTNICPEKKSLGINEDGGFTEEFVISSKYVIPIPDQLENERAILIEPLAVIVHALKKVTITDETSVAIIGCGTEGMLTIALTQYLGGKITAIDINETKLKEVKKHYPNVQTSHPKDVQSDQFDIVIEVAGVNASVKQSIEIVKPSGCIILIGLPDKATIPVAMLVRKEVKIEGSIIYNIPEDFESSIDYLLDTAFHIEPIISDIMPIKQYEKAFAMAASGKYRKILLEF